MSVPPPPTITPPQYSPDGQWWWDGRQWQRVEPPPGFGARRGMPVWGWIGIGCGALLLLSMIAGLIFGVVGYRLLTSTWCPPSDFPRPANSRLANWHVFTGSGGTTCEVGWTVDDSAAVLTSYYQSRLQTGDWRTLGTNPQSDIILFGRASDPAVTGTVMLLAHGSQTDVEVRLTSPRADFNRHP